MKKPLLLDKIPHLVLIQFRKKFNIKNEKSKQVFENKIDTKYHTALKHQSIHNF